MRLLQLRLPAKRQLTQSIKSMRKMILDKRKKK